MLAVLALGPLLGTTLPVSAQSGARNGEWPTWGRDPSSTFSPRR
jgi:hypothetical protein